MILLMLALFVAGMTSAFAQGVSTLSVGNVRNAVAGCEGSFDITYGAQNEAYNEERNRKTPEVVYLQTVARVGAVESPQNEMFT